MTCTNPGQLAAQEMVQAKLVELGEPFSKQEPTYEEIVSVYSIEVGPDPSLTLNCVTMACCTSNNGQQSF